MNIELTSEQQAALNPQGEKPQRVVDPRTRTSYVLVPEEEYEAILDDDRREQAIHAVALRNAAARLDEIP